MENTTHVGHFQKVKSTYILLVIPSLLILVPKGHNVQHFNLVDIVIILNKSGLILIVIGIIEVRDGEVLRRIINLFDGFRY